MEKKKKKKAQSKCHVLVKQVCFSYGESPRTPPLEGTSLHRRNISVERPWGILSLFTACIPLWVKSSRQCRCHASPTLEKTEPEWMTSAVEEDPQKSLKKIKKNELFQ